VNLPTGTVTSAAPTVDWTYAQVDGDRQQGAAYKIYTAAQQEVSTFNPDTTPPIHPASQTYTVVAGDTLRGIAQKLLGDASYYWDIYNASNLKSGNPDLIYPGEVVVIPPINVVEGDITNFTLPFSLPADDYYIYVRVTSEFGAKSVWVGRAFTVQAGAPGVPGGSFGGVGTGGGGGFESVIADSVSSTAYLTLRDGSNMLSVQQADFELATDALGFSGTNCTVAQDTTSFYNIGSGSMKLTASSAATMTAQSSYTEIAPNTPVTARAQFKGAAARSTAVNVLFFDEQFNSVGGTITSTGADSSGTWTEVVATGTTPSTAAYAQVQVEVDSPANGEVHNVDAVGLMYGSGSVWSHGGHASRNLLSSAASNADDPITVEPWTAALASTYARSSVSGTGADGSKMFGMTYAGLSPTVSYVATGTAFTDTTTGTGYTLNKPTGVADGDLLVAYVASDTGGTAVPPDSTWTLLDTTTVGTTSPVTLSVLIHDGLAADPASWVGNLTNSATRKRAIVVAYRGAAPVASQFDAENVQGYTNGTLNPTTATVSNTDTNAWRLSAFAVRDNAAGGTMIANILPPSTPPPIAYVGKGGVWSSSSSSTSYTINKPSGVVANDWLFAALSVSGAVTVTPPSGWTLVRTVTKDISGGDDHSGSTTLAIMRRKAGSSEPASWSGTHSSIGIPKMTQCVAYRNLDGTNPLIDEGGATSTSRTQSTTTVTNDNSSAWRLSIFSYTTDVQGSMTSNEVTERADNSTAVSSHPDEVVGVYDSNGPISSGNHSRSASLDGGGYYGGGASQFSDASWIGILKPLSSGVTPGANETERQDATAGSATPWLTLAAYDSAGVAPTGAQSVTGQFSPGSGTSTDAAATWIGFLKPGVATTAGSVEAVLSSAVDITSVAKEVIDRAEQTITVTASFLGSTAGVPYIKLYAYVGDELVSTQIQTGTSFGTDTWAKSVAQFPIPQGMTRFKIGLMASDRNVGDVVYFDRISAAFGKSSVYRPGTGNAAHPIFSVPQIEYAEDAGNGYGDWKTLGATARALLKYDQLTGLTTFIDQTIIPLVSRKYRARTVSYGLNGDVFTSDYGPESQECQLIANEWWLKDLDNLDNSLSLKVKADDVDMKITDTSTVFQPLGSDRPVIVGEGYKGDTIPLTFIVRRDKYAKLRALLNSGRTLYLQSDSDGAWWVKPQGDIGVSLKPSSKHATDPVRFVSVTFMEVDPEG
jgi:LysM repeat protein